MYQYKYQQRSLLLLLPLGLLAIVSYALDNRIPIGIGYSLQSLLLELSRNILPAFVAVTIACMIPSINRFFQLFSVGFNYTMISSVSLSLYPDLFTQPTAWVISALTATLFFLPSNEEETGESISFYQILLKACGVILIPSLTLISIMVIIRNIEHSILLTFTSVFVDSILSCLFVPIYEIMLSLGFSSLLNSLVSLQSNSHTIQAMLNSILMTNMFSLPAIIMTKAICLSNQKRLFLVFLAIITSLTSTIGSCISVELAILLFFFPNTILAISLSSIVTFFICYHLQLSTFTNFYMLYQPDLILKNLTFLHMSYSHFMVIICALILPVFIQTGLDKLIRLGSIKHRLKHKARKATCSANLTSSPDLILIALLKNLGGKSNISSVSFFNFTLEIKVYDFNVINSGQINAICGRKTYYSRSDKKIILHLQDKSQQIYIWLSNFIEASRLYNPIAVQISEPFDIHTHIKNLQEKSKVERYRLDPN